MTDDFHGTVFIVLALAVGGGFFGGVGITLLLQWMF